MAVSRWFKQSTYIHVPIRQEKVFMVVGTPNDVLS